MIVFIYYPRGGFWYAEFVVKGRKQQIGSEFFRNVKITGGCWTAYELIGFILRSWLGFGKWKLNLGDKGGPGNNESRA